MNSVDFLLLQCNLSRVKRAIEHQASHKRDSKAIEMTRKGALVETFNFRWKRDFTERIFERRMHEYNVSKMKILDMRAYS